MRTERCEMNNKLLKTTRQVQKLCAKLGLRRNTYQVPSDRQVYMYCSKYGDHYKRMVTEQRIERIRFKHFKKRAKNDYKHGRRPSTISRQPRRDGAQTTDIRGLRPDLSSVLRTLQTAARHVVDRVGARLRR